MPGALVYFCGVIICMNRLRWLAVLMGITILGITGFQLYWLKQNYDREKKTMAIKSEVIFRQAIQQLQVSKLKLDELPCDSAGNVKIFMGDGGNGEKIRVHVTPKTEIISTVNIIGEKLKDSLKKKTGVFITRDNMTVNFRRDSAGHDEGMPRRRHQDQIIQLLYGVDSLQDTLSLAEISTVFSGAMKAQTLTIP
jgi:two-component system phosphate regulon sensor histidine kinase PhoR